MSKRYAQAEVDEAIAQVERGVFTPHAQIVLASEVLATRADIARVDVAVRRLIGAMTYERAQCEATLRELADAVKAQRESPEEP